MAGKEDVQLLGLLVSPFVIRVRMALSMKGVSYEYIEQDLGNKSELLVRSNPVHKKVPVLIHEGVPICESLVILQYIDEAWAATGPSILPADPYESAVARFWATYVDGKLFPVLLGVLRAATDEERADKFNEMHAVVGDLEEAFAKGASGKAFFGGDSIGYLDLVVGSYLIWLEVLRRMFGVAAIDIGRTPLLAAWATRFEDGEVVKEVVPDVDMAVERAKKMRPNRAAYASGK